jgi:hypothetical protein
LVSSKARDRERGGGRRKKVPVKGRELGMEGTRKEKIIHFFFFSKEYNQQSNQIKLLCR